MHIKRKFFRNGANVYITIEGTPEEVQQEVNCLYNFGALSRIPEDSQGGGIDADYKEGVSTRVEVHGPAKNLCPALKGWFRTKLRNVLTSSDLAGGYARAKESVKLWQGMVEEEIQAWKDSLGEQEDAES